MIKSIALRLLALSFLAWAAFYLLTALCAIANFAWRQPMFDQWRMYADFLARPFPQNVLQSENSHHPIIPNLVRSAETHWFAADQLLQISVGTLCAFLTAGIVAISVWRECELPVVARSAGVMLAVLGVFWLANARMLLHGNESLQTYLVTLCVVCAGLCTWRAHEHHALRWLAAASAACAVATFSFGSGIASFPAIIVLGVLLRLPWRWLLLPTGTLAACLTLYMFILPGEQSVRGVLELHPVESACAIVQWLSSPWVNGWLGLADPPLSAWLGPRLGHTLLARTMVASANLLVVGFGGTWQSLAAGVGALGMFVLLGRTGMFYLRRNTLGRTQALAIALCVFVLATAVVIGIGRIGYFNAYPDQVYADRYLMWSCLFWMGLALLLLIDVSRRRRISTVLPGLLFLIAIPQVLLPTHRAWSGWGAIVYQQAQLTAAAARSGVFDPALFPDDAAASRASRQRALTLLRERHLAMFADPAWQLVGKPSPWPMTDSKDFSIEAKIAALGTDGEDGQPFARVSGTVSSGIAHIQKNGDLAIVDSNDVIVGLAEFSQLKPGSKALRFDMPRKRGFDGYIRQFDPHETYTLALLVPDAHQALRLAPVTMPK